MDEPNIGRDERREALRGLARINRASRVAQRIWQSITIDSDVRQLTMLDVASGGGDVAIALAQLVRRDNVRLDIVLLDRDADGLALAAAEAQRAGIVIRTIVADALAQPWPDGPFDLVTCSLFLHHLTKEQTIALLKRMAEAAQGLVIISDLRRSIMGWLLARVGTRILSRSPIVHHDGPISVRAAWTVYELKKMAVAAGMENAGVRRCWPWRMMLTWQRDDKGQ